MFHNISVNDKTRNPLHRLILALDVPDRGRAAELVGRFAPHIDIFKVGLELYTAAGPSVVEEVHKRGRKVFLDLKFHDIPNTVAKAAVSAARLGVFMFDVHTSGGAEMMKRCRDGVVEVCLRENLDMPRILGITVLTSISDEVLRNEVGVQHGIGSQVRHLAGLARDVGLDGVVASAHEASMLRDLCGKGFLIVTPGIRPSWTPADDQKRTMTPRDALLQGADYLVIGRAVLNHSDPEQAIAAIRNEIASV